ncbi:hypothetical protein JCM10908_004672 [Rhodotorula pacifica]|uniref:uncharacterized protein n=1 Tax=Rhodotorula pacifica TaxID=1495444 RepID=UPI00317A2402
MRFADALGLHKSATFNATITIHELTQVPLLNAKFRIKWKFKGATTSSHAGADTPNDDASSNTSERHNHHHLRGVGHGLASRWLHPKSALSSSTSVNGISSSSSTATASATPKGHHPTGQRHRSPSGSGSRFDRSSSDDDDSDPNLDPDPSSPPLHSRNGPFSPNAGNDPGRTPNPNRTPGPAFTNSFASGSGDRNVEFLYSSAGDQQQQGGERDPGGSSLRRRGMSEVSLGTGLTSPTGPPAAATASGPEPRGKTAVVALRCHTATFNREVTCPVSISLRPLADSKKYQLQPSPVRLSIRQQNMAEDHKVEEEKLGEVVLDLSQPTLKSGQISSNSSSGLKALAALHGSPANRSNVSLGKSSQATGTSASRLSTSASSQVASSNASTHMSRTNSVSSHLSAQSSARSTPSPERTRAKHPRSSKQKKGWHPPHSVLSSAATPMILGSCGSSHANDQRSAAEIIDALFNRPPPRESRERHGLGEPFDYRPALSRNPSAQTETGASIGSGGGGGGGRFSRARKAWSIRSGKNGKATSTTAPNGASTNSGEIRADIGRDQPEVPIAASYAQDEAPAERKRQKDRDGLLRDVTHDIGARFKGKRQGSTDSVTSTATGQSVPSAAASSKPKLSLRTATSLRRADSASQSSATTVTEDVTTTTTNTTSNNNSNSRPLLGAPVPRRPSFPASTSSRPVSIRWGDQDSPSGEKDLRRQPSNASLATALPRSILGLGLTEETAARAANSPEEAREQPASAISFESRVTPPSPSPAA